MTQSNQFQSHGGQNGTAILRVPELIALVGASSLIRIPNQIDVPVTQRVKRLIDTPEFQRLAEVSQLGVVALVYPGANHNRFEHSLGVYRNALLFLRQLASDPVFSQIVTPRDAELLIVAALLHDIGHWPFCHPIEDIGIAGLPSHESFAAEYLERTSIAGLLRSDWSIEPHEVVEILRRNQDRPAQAILSSILSGPIDIDKMDYLYRDSLHAGVPYGQNFDAQRLIRSLCLNQPGDRLAITRKGKTAAELMVFSRYVMFSEVYWHHAVRSATAMFQRAFYLWHQAALSRLQLDDEQLTARYRRLFETGEREMIGQLLEPMPSSSSQPAVTALLESLFGRARQLYKRVANYSCHEHEPIYRRIAQRPYAWLKRTSDRLSELVSESIGEEVSANEILIDAPPVGLEVQFNVDVYYPELDSYRSLGEVSPMVNTLARQQFDDFVKQVRIFVHPRLLEAVKRAPIDCLVESAVAETQNHSP